VETLSAARQIGETMDLSKVISGNRVTVVGLGRSGLGAARLLDRAGAQVCLTDRRPAEALREQMEQVPARVSLFLGEHPDNLFTMVDLVVVSPGVPADIPPLRSSRSRNIPVVGELELAFRFTEAPFVAVTGTNGKSTVTELVGQMMKEDGREVFVGGNIGRSLTEHLAGLDERGEEPPEWFVAEVSSFQLETIQRFRPRVAAVLNLTADHLDRHGDLDGYGRAKARLFENQINGDHLVLNADDESVAAFAALAPGSVAWFSRNTEVPRGVFVRDDEIVARFDGPDRIVMIRDDIRIRGVHNLENALAAAAIAMLAGVSPDSVACALRAFPGLPHRLETVAEFGGIRYVNDSKGTNVGAVIRSLESFDSPVVLIAGGSDKGTDFKVLRSAMAGRVRTLVLIGETAPRLAREAAGSIPVRYADHMNNAVSLARSVAEPGDTVLLSPACASFDMFRNFEDRGDQFRKAVQGIRE